MMNSTITHSISNKNDKIVSNECYKIMVKLLKDWLTYKKKPMNNFYNLEEAMMILGFQDEIMKRQMEENGILLGKEAEFVICTGVDCTNIYKHAPRAVNFKGEAPQLTKEFLHQNSDPKDVVNEAQGNLYDAANILCGARPTGKCCACGSATTSIRFKEPSKVLMVSFNNVTNFLDNFEFKDLQNVPLIDYDGNVHRYKLTTVLLNLPAGVHWTCVAINDESKVCVQLESLVAGGILPGKPIKQSWQWLLQNKANIGGLILVKTNQAAKTQNEATELVLSALQNFKLTTDDIRKCTHSTLMTMMEYRNIWHLFKDLVSTQQYYANQQIELEQKTYQAGDKLPYGFLDLLQFARDKKISSLHYDSRYKLFPTRVRDVMTEWCKQFESRWNETNEAPTKRELIEFTNQMILHWETKKKEASKQNHSVDIDLSHDLESEKVPVDVQNILQAKKLRITETFDSGFEVVGTASSKSRAVKLNVSASAMMRFANDGWFEIILATDLKTRLDFVQPNATKVELKTSKVKRIHLLQKLELITAATNLDKTKAVWFIPNVKKVTDAPQKFFRVTCDPIPMSIIKRK